MKREFALIADRPYKSQVIGKSRVFIVEKGEWQVENKQNAVQKTFLLNVAWGTSAHVLPMKGAPPSPATVQRASRPRDAGT